MAVDPSTYVAPTAVVHPEASIGPGCHIGEFCVIERDVEIGTECRLEPYVFVKRWTTMGDRNEISAGTILGTDPLDKSFTGERSYLRMGDGNRIREHFTVSRGTRPESVTLIGNGNYVMTSGHIAHNCVIGNNAVIASCSLVSGYVEVEDGAFISGGVAIHQFSKIGRLSMVGGHSGVNLDVPPFLMTVGFRVEAIGPNTVGMRRAGYKSADVLAVKEAFRLLYMSGLPRGEVLARLEAGPDVGREMAAFIRSSKRGICPARRKSLRRTDELATGEAADGETEDAGDSAAE
ncbi:MAG: acyl-ACP--UDP-N-acetylglucosamine O-acyltransferase [Bryobacteraceae bacterium]|nr:acyl-ACP--UDP-N-acetylglucosamine O-acyltransferase [Bryobacteraceae bacterium]